MERTRKIIIILIALVALISVAQAITNFPITADKITVTSTNYGSQNDADKFHFIF